jgi:large subunit ribosomal protein L20
MPRVKRGNKRLQRRKKILKLAKGYKMTKSKLYRSAKESVERALKFAYIGRCGLYASTQPHGAVV